MVMRTQFRVVVTGGSAGIGRSIVEVFAEAGHLVLFTYLRSVEASVELERRWGNVQKIQLDQGDIASVERFGKSVKTWCRGDGVDVLVNNAALGSATVRDYVDSINGVQGGGTANGAIDVSAKKDRDMGANGTCGSAANCGSVNGATERNVLRVAAEDVALMQVNALGPLWVTEAIESSLLQAARREGGRGRSSVIFIGSVGGGSAAVFPEYRCSDLMSKAAMTYLVKHLAAQYVRDALDVVCVAPGATETDMFRQSTLSKIRDVAAFIDGMPKRQLIQPREVADTVLWLATDPAARIFHGAILDASLGLAVRPGLQTESAGTR